MSFIIKLTSVVLTLGLVSTAPTYSSECQDGINANAGVSILGINIGAKAGLLNGCKDSNNTGYNKGSYNSSPVDTGYDGKDYAQPQKADNYGNMKSSYGTEQKATQLKTDNYSSPKPSYGTEQKAATQPKADSYSSPKSSYGTEKKAATQPKPSYGTEEKSATQPKTDSYSSPKSSYGTEQKATTQPKTDSYSQKSSYGSNKGEQEDNYDSKKSQGKPQGYGSGPSHSQGGSCDGGINVDANVNAGSLDANADVSLLNPCKGLLSADISL